MMSGILFIPLAAALLSTSAAVAANAAPSPELCRIYEISDARIKSDGKRTANQRGVLAYAEQICDGKQRFFGTEIISIGRRGIDWSGGQRKHQEWVAQLNRFLVFKPLIYAWRMTGDDRYPARAREMMEDWFDFWEKNQFRFLDPQRDNLLNVSQRLEHWGNALIAFRNTPAFADPAFTARAREMIRRQADGLCQRTEPGDSNFQVIQSSVLIRTGLLFADLPGAAAWRERGGRVMAACFTRQFRADGTHVENTTGYHLWVLSLVIKCAELHELGRLPELRLPADLLRRGIDFSAASAPFAFNDSNHFFSGFPRWDTARLDTCRALARAIGIADYRPPVRAVFPGAGFVFGGTDADRFCFDASDYGERWHSHLSRLTLATASYGRVMVLDPGVITYERRNAEWFEFGKGTRSHAGVYFSGTNQIRGSAKLAFAELRDDFSLVSGDYRDGYSFEPANGPRPPRPELHAEVRRTLLHLPEEYLLVFDRIKTASLPRPELTVNVHFPVGPMAHWDFDRARNRFASRNDDDANLTCQLLWSNQPSVAGSCVEGQKSPELRGWGARRAENFVPCPSINFSVPAKTGVLEFVTLIAPRPAGTAAPDYPVIAAEPGRLELARPDGGRDLLRYAPDFRTVRELSAAGKRVRALLLLVRTAPDGTVERVVTYPDPERSGTVSGTRPADTPPGS